MIISSITFLVGWGRVAPITIEIPGVVRCRNNLNMAGGTGVGTFGKFCSRSPELQIVSAIT